MQKKPSRSFQIDEKIWAKALIKSAIEKRKVSEILRVMLEMWVDDRIIVPLESKSLNIKKDISDDKTNT